MVPVTGLAARRGDTAFAFIALRFAAPASRAQVARVLEHLAPLVAEADAPLAEADDPVRLIAVPWAPAETGAGLALQRRLLEGAGALGVDAAWCLQAGTSLPPAGAVSDEDDDVAWSHGPPPQVRELRFPLDGSAAAIAAHDGGDLGLALKLAGPPVPGEDGVLRAFHALWLAPYGARYRDASVTFDRAHRAVHLWVARFAPPCWPEQLVHHLMWIAARIDEVLPVVHGRVTAAPEARAPGELGPAPLVLAGNPLAQMYDAGGEAAVDAWLAAQRDWSPEEQAHMLRELALQLVADTGDEPVELAARLDEDDEDEGDDEDDDDDDDLGPGDPGEHADDDEDDDDDDEDDEPEGNADEDRGRQVTRQAGELLRLRAAASRLDPRAAEALIPVLGERSADDARRGAAIDVLGALGDPAAVPALTHVARAGAKDALADRASRALLAIADDTSVN